MIGFNSWQAIVFHINTIYHWDLIAETRRWWVEYIWWAIDWWIRVLDNCQILRAVVNWIICYEGVLIVWENIKLLALAALGIAWIFIWLLRWVYINISYLKTNSLRNKIWQISIKEWSKIQVIKMIKLCLCISQLFRIYSENFHNTKQ